MLAYIVPGTWYKSLMVTLPSSVVVDDDDDVVILSEPLFVCAPIFNPDFQNDVQYLNTEPKPYTFSV